MKARINCTNFLARTAGFSCMTIGVYATVFCLIGDRGPVKRHDPWLARICGCRINQFRDSLQQLLDNGLLTNVDGLLGVSEQNT